jgi:hypothetical protein
MEKELTEQDSLKLINEMIFQAQNNIQKGAGNMIIFWGYSITVIALLNIILLYAPLPAPHYSFWVWTLTIPLSIISHIIKWKKNKEAIVRSHFDRIINKTWIGFLISITIALLSIYMSVYLTGSWKPCILITPIILTFTGIAQYISGIAMRFTPFVNGGYVFWCGALLSLLILIVLPYTSAQLAILIISMLIGFVVPGHLLNRKVKNNV